MEKLRTASLDWTYKGMRTLVLENDEIKVSVLLDKGSDIFEIISKKRNLDVMWHAPKGYRNPATTPQSIATPDGAFHDTYGGGWNDVFPNYGFASNSNLGSQYGLHGESSILPWECNLSEDSSVAHLELECVRLPLRAEKKMEIDDQKAVLEISESLTNLGEETIQFSWAQHIAFGEPLVSPDLEVQIPGIRGLTHDLEMRHERVKRNQEFEWPFAPGIDGNKVNLEKIPSREERAQEDFAITKLKERRYTLYNPIFDLGVEVEWNETYPFLWYWLNWGTFGYPSFGRSRTLALEPCTSTEGGGLADQIKNGHVINLEAGKSVTADVRFSLFSRKM